MSTLSNLQELRSKIEEGSIDTVIVAFPDHLGRLMGKQVTGWYFLDYMVESGMHACDYLLSVDMEMNPQSGFDMAGWDKGYGDFHGVVDMHTLRPVPWLSATAMVLCDLQWENGNPVVESPRSILRRQIERAAERGFSLLTASELEFYLFDQPPKVISENGLTALRPSSEYSIDYHLLQTSADEPLIREIRNSMGGARIPVEFSKGEWGSGQHEINIRYSDALETADRHAIYKNGVKEIAANRGYSATFMAKQNAESAGSSCHLHVSLFEIDSENNLFWDKSNGQETALFRNFLGGVLTYSSDYFLFLAPTINSYKRYQPSTFAPTAIAWSRDNRTTGYRIVGREASFRIENRMPGADANPYLALAATIAAGLAGIDEELDCGEPYKGNAYVDAVLPRVPQSLTTAANNIESSDSAQKAFGAEVVNHYVRLARLEQQAFDAAVTDWEQRRYFERI